MLTLNDCRVTLSKRCVLSIKELSLDTQGITMIVGSNGSGKTLLLKLLARLLPHSGTLENHQHLDFPQKTWVPHYPVLLDRSVYDNIALPLTHQQVSAIDDRVTAALAWSNI